MGSSPPLSYLFLPAQRNALGVGGRRGYVAGIPGKRERFQCALLGGTAEKDTREDEAKSFRRVGLTPGEC